MMSKTKPAAKAAPAPARTRGEDIHRTLENRDRRIAKDKANHERAKRKRAQRQRRDEMALLTSPNYDPRFVNVADAVHAMRNFRE